MIQLCGIFRDCDILNGNKPLFERNQKKKDNNFEEIFQKECEKLKKEGEKR